MIRDRAELLDIITAMENASCYPDIDAGSIIWECPTPSDVAEMLCFYRARGYNIPSSAHEWRGSFLVNHKIKTVTPLTPQYIEFREKNPYSKWNPDDYDQYRWG